MSTTAKGRQVHRPRSGSASSPSGWRWLTPGRALVLGLAVALVVAGVLIGVSALGSDSSRAVAPDVSGASATSALFSGIPQHGNVLGSTSAPATLVEFAEPQCPICGVWARDTLPTVVHDYVRTGRLKIVFHGLSFLRPVGDSDRALRALAAAGKQGRLFNLLDVLYRNQGQEGSGWITERLLRSLGAAVPGLDVEQMMADSTSAATTAALAESAQAARQVMGANVRTPTFLVGRSGRQLAVMPIASREQLGAGGFASLLDQMTAP